MPTPGTPLVDPKTGILTATWWQWMLSIFFRSGGTISPNADGVIGLTYVQAEVEDALALASLQPPSGALTQGIAEALSDAAAAQRLAVAPLDGLDWLVGRPMTPEPDFLGQFLASATPGMPPPGASAWTPQLLFGGAHSGMTGSFVGEVVTLGPLVWVFCAISLTAQGASTGAATISGLPIPVGANQSCRFTVSGASGLGGGLIEPGLLAVTNTIALFTSVASFADTNVTDAQFTNASALQFSGWYFRA